MRTDREVWDKMDASELVEADHYAEIGDAATLRKITERKRKQLEAEDKKRAFDNRY